MAFYYEEPSRTFSEYLLIPGYSSVECVPSKVSPETPLVKFEKGKGAGTVDEYPWVRQLCSRSLTTGLRLPWLRRAVCLYLWIAAYRISGKMIEKSSGTGQDS